MTELQEVENLPINDVEESDDDMNSLRSSLYGDSDDEEDQENENHINQRRDIDIFNIITGRKRFLILSHETSVPSSYISLFNCGDPDGLAFLA